LDAATALVCVAVGDFGALDPGATMLAFRHAAPLAMKVPCKKERYARRTARANHRSWFSICEERHSIEANSLRP
jgi:hypothetical protein